MGSKKNKSNETPPTDPRVEGIGTVGWITLASLGICIPLTKIVGDYSALAAAAIPLAVIIGAGIMAIRIWSSGEKQVNRKENERLKQSISELEKRLANLEMVDSMEAHFAERHRQSETEPNPSVSSPTMGPARDQSTA